MLWTTGTRAAPQGAAAGDLLPPPSVTNQAREPLTVLSIASLQTGSKIHISLKEAVAKLPAVSEWSLYLVTSGTDDIKWSVSKKGPPPEPIEWDGRLDDGTYPRAGAAYELKAVLQSAGAYRKTRAQPLGVQVISTELIEINRVDERIGLGSFRFAGDNGQTVEGIGGHFATRILLGGLTQIEMSSFKELSAKSYHPAMDDASTRARVSIAEGYAGAMGSFGAFKAGAGAGLVYVGANMPFETGTTDEETGEERKLPGTREKIQAPAGALWLGYEHGDVSAFSRTSGSRSRGGRHLSESLVVDYRLTRTWYTGLDATTVAVGAAASGAPGFSLLAVGAHIGFAFDRLGGP